jgi:ribosomal protein S18 acetylase RimI-like enzyme
MLRAPDAARDLAEVAAREAASYPEDEAASVESLERRMRDAPDFFRLWISENKGAEGAAEPSPEREALGDDAGDDGADGSNSESLLGFVCGTRWNEDSLGDDSMGGHDPAGGSLCIHSVVVGEEHRRRGVGLAMVRAFVNYIRGGLASGGAFSGLKRILLICKRQLVSFYSAAGFHLRGRSVVVHGKDPWFEMCLPLTPVPFPFPRGALEFECHLYDGTKNKNDWHYVEIAAPGPKKGSKEKKERALWATHRWKNRAGASWDLRLRPDGQVFEVGEDCPYFSDGHTLCLILRDDAHRICAVLGPWDERYDIV